MNPDLNEYYQKFKELFLEEFYPVLNRKIDRQIEFLREISELQKKLKNNIAQQEDKAKKLNFVVGYKEKIKVSINKRFNIGAPAGFDEEFRKFDETSDQYLLTIPENFTREQDWARFTGQPGDPLRRKIAKFFKRILFYFTRFPHFMVNGFARLLKKKPKRIKHWKHHVHLRDLTTYFLKERFSFRILQLKDVVYHNIAKTAMVAWKSDEAIDRQMNNFLLSDGDIDIHPGQQDALTEAIEQMESLRMEVSKKGLEILDELNETYKKEFRRVGTMELSNRKFNLSHLRHSENTTNRYYMNHHEEWQNTFLLLSDDWGIDIDLYHIIFGSILEYWLSVRRFDNRIDQTILKRIKPWEKELLLGLEHIRKSEDDHLKEVILQERDNASKLLSDQHLIDLNDMILGHDLPSLVNNIEAKVDRLISGMEVKRTIMNDPDLLKPVKSGAFSTISPYELINFESYPQLLRSTKKIKVQITENLNKCQNNILYLGQIVGFNLDSALELFDEDEPEDEPRQIAVQGMERSVKQLEDLQLAFTRLKNLVDEELLEAFTKFFGQLIAFTDNENILEIRVRIAKGKAIQQSRRLHERALTSMREFMPHLVSQARTHYTHINARVLSIFKRYGLAGKPVIVTADLADFLAETKQSIQKLPFVYQRLFKSESITDENFFVGRRQELQALFNAYNNWTKGRFAATAIVGEKGSGLTTLINFFLNDLATTGKVHRLVMTGTIKSRQELFVFLKNGLELEVEDFESLIAELRNDQKKRVIILEDIQNGYMKRIGGFDSIRMFTEVIAHTSRQVFWLASSTEYAWNYLDKTCHISDHFGYVVRLADFDNETINNIIRKRHKVSGYNLEFEPSSQDRQKNKFLKLSAEERHDYLEADYFSELNKIARSNVSLALIYWLRSTREVREDTIVIRSLKDRDLSFMDAISGEKLYGLAALILHEGLSEENFSTAMSISRDRSRSILHPLYEDGILSLEEDQYVVNPLLYRKTINLLKSKNIIH